MLQRLGALQQSIQEAPRGVSLRWLSNIEAFFVEVRQAERFDHAFQRARGAVAQQHERIVEAIDQKVQDLIRDELRLWRDAPSVVQADICLARLREIEACFPDLVLREQGLALADFVRQSECRARADEADYVRSVLWRFTSPDEDVLPLETELRELQARQTRGASRLRAFCKDLFTRIGNHVSGLNQELAELTDTTLRKEGASLCAEDAVAALQKLRVLRRFERLRNLVEQHAELANGGLFGARLASLVCRLRALLERPKSAGGYRPQVVRSLLALNAFLKSDLVADLLTNSERHREEHLINALQA